MPQLSKDHNFLSFNFGFDQEEPFILYIAPFPENMAANSRINLIMYLEQPGNPSYDFTGIQVQYRFPFDSSGGTTVYTATATATGTISIALNTANNLAYDLTADFEVEYLGTLIGFTPITSWLTPAPVTPAFVTAGDFVVGGTAFYQATGTQGSRVKVTLNSYRNVSGNFIADTPVKSFSDLTDATNTLSTPSFEIPQIINGVLVYSIDVTATIEHPITLVTNTFTFNTSLGVTSTAPVFPVNITTNFDKSATATLFAKIAFNGTNIINRSFVGRATQNSSGSTVGTWIFDTDSDGDAESELAQIANLTGACTMTYRDTETNALLGTSAFTVSAKPATTITHNGASPIYTGEQNDVFNEITCSILVADGFIFRYRLINPVGGAVIATSTTEEGTGSSFSVTLKAPIAYTLAPGNIVGRVEVLRQTDLAVIETVDTPNIPILRGLSLDAFPPGVFYRTQVFNVTGLAPASSLVNVNIFGSNFSSTSTSGGTYSVAVTVPIGQAYGATPMVITSVGRTVNTSITITDVSFVVTSEPQTGDLVLTGEDTFCTTGNGLPGSVITMTLVGFGGTIILTDTVDVNGNWEICYTPGFSLSSGAFSFDLTTPANALEGAKNEPSNPGLTQRPAIRFLNSANNPITFIFRVQESPTFLMSIQGKPNEVLDIATANPSLFSYPVGNNTVTLDGSGLSAGSMPAIPRNTNTPLATSLNVTTNSPEQVFTSSINVLIDPKVPITININSQSVFIGSPTSRPDDILFINTTYALSGDAPTDLPAFTLGTSGATTSITINTFTANTYTATLLTANSPLGEFEITANALYQESVTESFLLSPVLWYQIIGVGVNVNPGETFTVRVHGTVGQTVKVKTTSPIQTRNLFNTIPVAGFRDFFVTVPGDVESGDMIIQVSNSYFSYDPFEREIVPFADGFVSKAGVTGNSMFVYSGAMVFNVGSSASSSGSISRFTSSTGMVEALKIAQNVPAPVSTAVTCVWVQTSSTNVITETFVVASNNFGQRIQVTLNASTFNFSKSGTGAIALTGLSYSNPYNYQGETYNNAFFATLESFPSSYTFRIYLEGVLIIDVNQPVALGNITLYRASSNAGSPGVTFPSLMTPAQVAAKLHPTQRDVIGIKRVNPRYLETITFLQWFPTANTTITLRTSGSSAYISPVLDWIETGTPTYVIRDFSHPDYLLIKKSAYFDGAGNSTYAGYSSSSAFTGTSNIISFTFRREDPSRTEYLWEAAFGTGISSVLFVGTSVIRIAFSSLSYREYSYPVGFNHNQIIELAYVGNGQILLNGSLISGVNISGVTLGTTSGNFLRMGWGLTAIGGVTGNPFLGDFMQMSVMTNTAATAVFQPFSDSPTGLQIINGVHPWLIMGITKSLYAQGKSWLHNMTHQYMLDDNSAATDLQLYAPLLTNANMTGVAPPTLVNTGAGTVTYPADPQRTNAAFFPGNASLEAGYAAANFSADSQWRMVTVWLKFSKSSCPAGNVMPIMGVTRGNSTTVLTSLFYSAVTEGLVRRPGIVLCSSNIAVGHIPDYLIPDNTWFHVCFSMHKSTNAGLMYINGELATSSLVDSTWVAPFTTTYTTTNVINIGRVTPTSLTLATGGTAQLFYTGYMSDFRLYRNFIPYWKIREQAEQPLPQVGDGGYKVPF